MKWGGERPVSVSDWICAVVLAVAALAFVLAFAMGVGAEGETVIDRGSAAYYARSYDHGGWESIIRRRIAWGQIDEENFQDSPFGYYCVRPGLALGTVVTLTNARTGAYLNCTVADTVAPADQPYWWRHFVIEISYAAWEALGLAGGNDVIVSS